MAAGPHPHNARRQRREEIQTAVRQATVELVAESPFHDLTIDDIARRAGLTRSAFYFYFRDKHDVLMGATEDVIDLLYAEADRWWHGEGKPPELIRSALSGVVHVYAQNANLLRVASEVSSYNEDVRQTWRRLVERFITATGEHIAREREGGQCQHLDDARAAAEALVWMTERYCYVYLGRSHTEGETVDTLSQIWLATVYP